MDPREFALVSSKSFSTGLLLNTYLHMGALHWPPLQEALALPAGAVFSGALMVGEPRYRYQRLPARREPSITWR